MNLEPIRKLLAANDRFIHIEIALLVLLSGILQIRDIDQYTQIFVQPDIVINKLKRVHLDVIFVLQ